jgi:hypothetical protein
MTDAQQALFAKLLQLRARAAAALVTAQHLARVHNMTVNWGIGEVAASGQYSNEVMTACSALYDELRATARTVLPADGSTKIWLDTEGNPHWDTDR